jgi:hypothetical protein
VARTVRDPFGAAAGSCFGLFFFEFFEAPPDR